MVMENRLLHDLVLMNSTEAVLDEANLVLTRISPDFDTDLVTRAFTATIDLYRGNYPGYRACNTDYHDLPHTTNTFLATARLIHGSVLNGETFTDRFVSLCLIAALFHDSGYIQEEHDTDGTGAKYTQTHVRRSMDFMERAGPKLGLSDDEIHAGCTMISCTDLPVNISEITFDSTSCNRLSRILATADLLAQMADRSYLEKLLFLYREFKEAGVGGFENELDLLQKTVGFYDFFNQRLKNTLDSSDRFMTSHFIARWNIHKNLYREAIENQKNYLIKILEIPDANPLDHLRRDGIVEKVRKTYGLNN